MYPPHGKAGSVESIDPEVGRRLAALRRNAGLSREQLAGLAEVSATLIKFVESGRRALTLRTAQRIATHVGVRDLGDLYGPAVHLTLDGRPSHPSVPAVRRALTDWRFDLAGDASSPEYLKDAVDSAWRTWHSSPNQRSEVGALLPGLLDEGQRSARLLGGDQQRHALALLAEVHHVAQAFLAWHGERELVWLTVDRGVMAARESGDEVAISRSIWYAAHLLRAVGRDEEAREHVTRAIERIGPQVADGGTEYAAMLADLHLCQALTRARVADQGAWADWSSAADVIGRALPADYAHPWTRVGPVLLQVYAVQIATELGDPGEARRHADQLNPQAIPSVERRARHLIELARVADQEASREAVLHLLTRATDVSSETVQYSPMAIELVNRLATSGSAMVRADADALAARLKVNV